MRPFAVDFDSLVPELFRPLNHLFYRERISAVPNASIGDAVESNLDVGGRHGGAAQFRRGCRGCGQCRASHEVSSADSFLFAQLSEPPDPSLSIRPIVPPKTSPSICNH